MKINFKAGLCEWTHNLSVKETECFIEIAEFWDTTPEALYENLWKRWKYSNDMLSGYPLKGLELSKTSRKLLVSLAIQDMLRACNKNPENTKCGFCGKLNWFFDEDGYFHKNGKRYCLNCDELHEG